MKNFTSSRGHAAKRNNKVNISMCKIFGIAKTLLVAGSIVCLFDSRAFSQAVAQEGEDIFNLDKIVVTATRTEHTLADVPVATEVITREEMLARNVHTVHDALRYLTGVRVSETHGWGKGTVGIQGLPARHTLILVNGQRISGGHDGVDLQQVSMAMVERIEVVRGPASALYGSDAIGGVVNIITRTAPEEPTVSASTALGTRATQIHELSGGFRKGGVGVFLNHTYRTSEGRRKETDEYWENIFQGTLSYDFNPRSRLSVKPYYSRHEMRHEGRLQERFGLSSVLELTPDELSRLNLRGSLFNYQHWTPDRISDWDHDRYEADISYSRVFFERHTITGGYQLLQEDIVDGGKRYEADQTIHGFSIQNEIDLSPFTPVLGIRVDEHARWGTEISPRAGLLYKVTENLRLRGSVGTGFLAPPLVRLYADRWRMGPFLVRANPNLKPEESIGYQIGAEYQFSERLLTRLSFFRNDVDHLISHRIVRVGPAPWNMFWENIDEVRTQGVELSLVSRIMDNLTGEFGYTFLDTEDKRTGRDLTLRPEHAVTAGLGYTIPNIGVGINLSGQYIGSRYEDAANQIELGGYTIFNISSTKNIGENAQIFARVDNIFGRENIVDEYDIDGTEFLAGLRVEF